MIRCQNYVLSLWMFELSATSSNTTQAFSRFEKSFTALSNVNRSLWEVAPDNLNPDFLEFGECFRLCFKLAVSLQHCTWHVIVHWVISGEFGGTGPLWWNVDSWPTACCVCWRAVLLEDESGGQQAIAVFVWKQVANVIGAINFSFLFDKMQPFFATW